MKQPQTVPSLKHSDGTLKKVNPSACVLNNYRRIFPNQTLAALSLFADKKEQVLLYLLENADSGNIVFCSYAEIMEHCGIKDRHTVAEALETLQEAGVITKVSTSQYMLNPAVMLRGDDKKFCMLADKFKEYEEGNKKRKSNNKNKPQEVIN